ncbi:hypothetical protein Q8A73_023667 [Channa argus]|nr:hypothetical protein Q8A73_023667 [Channa argus]
MDDVPVSVGGGRRRKSADAQRRITKGIVGGRQRTERARQRSEGEELCGGCRDGGTWGWWGQSVLVAFDIDNSLLARLAAMAEFGGWVVSATRCPAADCGSSVDSVVLHLLPETLTFCACATEPPATDEGVPCPMNTKQPGTVRQVLSSQTQHSQSRAGAHKTARHVVGKAVQVGGGGGGGHQVCLIVEQSGMGGGGSSEFPDTAAGGQTVT